jgi:hypothetical protein
MMMILLLFLQKQYLGTAEDWRDAFSVQALYEAAETFMPATVAVDSDTDSTATDT